MNTYFFLTIECASHFFFRVFYLCRRQRHAQSSKCNRLFLVASALEGDFFGLWTSPPFLGMLLSVTASKFNLSAFYIEEPTKNVLQIKVHVNWDDPDPQTKTRLVHMTFCLVYMTTLPQVNRIVVYFPKRVGLTIIRQLPRCQDKQNSFPIYWSVSRTCSTFGTNLRKCYQNSP